MVFLLVPIHLMLGTNLQALLQYPLPPRLFHTLLHQHNQQPPRTKTNMLARTSSLVPRDRMVHTVSFHQLDSPNSLAVSHNIRLRFPLAHPLLRTNTWPHRLHSRAARASLLQYSLARTSSRVLVASMALTNLRPLHSNLKQAYHHQVLPHQSKVPCI